MLTKNWCYRAYKPTVHSELVEEQLWLTHRYRNKLCEIELARRAAVQTIIENMAPEYTAQLSETNALEESLNALIESIYKRGQSSRKKAKPTAEEKTTISAKKAELKLARTKLKELKTIAFSRDDIQAVLAEQNAENALCKKQARAASSLFWGTYLTVEAACDSFAKGTPPKFTKWSRKGSIAIQLQHGLTGEAALAGNDTRLKFVTGDLQQLLSEGKKAKHGRCHAEVLFRIGSEGRAPIFAQIPIRMHRPLPEGALIKWAYLERRTIGPHDYWQLRLTITMPEMPEMARNPRADFCVLHVGWRQLEDGSLLVGRWKGSDGQSGLIQIPNFYAKGAAIPHHLQSIRDSNFNLTKQQLIEYFKEHKSTASWAEEISTLHLWRSQARLAKLVTAWRQERYEGDVKGFELAEAWRKQDKHLLCWQSSQQINVIRWRDNFYRIMASGLSRQYGRICLMQADWAKLREKAELGQQETQTETMRCNASLAAVATLERFCKEAFGKDCLLEADIKGITQTCILCGHVNTKISDRVHECENCHRRWDIDENGIANQYARAELLWKSLPPLASVMAKRVSEENGNGQLSKRQSRFRSARKKAS